LKERHEELNAILIQELSDIEEINKKTGIIEK
jgi:hypothetical protein